MSSNFKTWIGKSVTRQDIVTQRIVDEYRATLAPYLFKPSLSDECPPGLHWCLALPAHETENLGPDGAEAKGLFLPPIPLPRRMWAGGQVETLCPLRVNDRIQRISTVSDVKMREGKGGSLCFVSVTHEISANGALALRERHDILFREPSRKPLSQTAADPAPQADLEWQVKATPLLLFRFSAITFNGHRIHYDLPYATETEGYEGLLVHGPMQAALTLNQLSAVNGKVPKGFDYRCVAPLIAGQTFRVWARRDGTGGAAGILNSAGVMTIEARGHE